MVPSLTETWVLQVDIPEICDLGSEAFSFPLIDKSVCVCVWRGQRAKSEGKRETWTQGCGGKIAIKLCFAIWEKRLKRNLKASDIWLSLILFNEV